MGVFGAGAGGAAAYLGTVVEADTAGTDTASLIDAKISVVASLAVSINPMTLLIWPLAVEASLSILSARTEEIPSQED